MVYNLNFPPPTPGKVSKWPNIDNLIKTKLIMFTCQPHIVNRINLFYYNFHHSDEFSTKWLTIILMSKYWTMYQVRKWSNIARLSKAKLNNSLSRPHLSKMMNLVWIIVSVLMNFHHNDKFSSQGWMFITMMNLYQNENCSSKLWLNEIPFITIMNFHPTDKFSSQRW